MEHFRYVALYKPYGVLSSFTDPEKRPTLNEYVDVPDVYAAGRLDYDSEGLLLLTDDGTLIHQMTDPRFHLPKTYLVEIEGLITPEAVSQLEQGVILQGERTRRCQAQPIPEPDLPPRSKPVTPHAPVSWLKIVLHEGKKRQIRHMTAAVGFPTLRIVRVAIGSIDLEGLQPGQWRYLSAYEASQLKQGR
jgi:23S rRNA pseudouridine2457 synthase